MVDSDKLGGSRESAIAGRSHTSLELQNYSGGVDLKGVVLGHVALHHVGGTVQLRHARNSAITCTIKPVIRAMLL